MSPTYNGNNIHYHPNREEWGYSGARGTKQDWLKASRGNPNVKGVNNQALRQPAARDSSTQPAGVAHSHCPVSCLLSYVTSAPFQRSLPTSWVSLSLAFSLSLLFLLSVSWSLCFFLLHLHSKIAFHSPLPIDLLHEICYMCELSAVYLV